MRSLFQAAACLALVAAPAAAQTTGVCEVNDLTLNGFGSGSTSCTPYGPLAGATLTMDSTHGPAAIGTLFAINLCPCTPCVLGKTPAPGPPVCAGPIPFSACGLTTNQSLDIIPGPCQPPALTFFAPAVAGGPVCISGVAPATSATFPLGPLPVGFTLSVQAFIFELSCFSPAWLLSPGPPPIGILKTQAYILFT